MPRVPGTIHIHAKSAGDHVLNTAFTNVSHTVHHLSFGRPGSKPVELKCVVIGWHLGLYQPCRAAAHVPALQAAGCSGRARGAQVKASSCTADVRQTGGSRCPSPILPTHPVCSLCEPSRKTCWGGKAPSDTAMCRSWFCWRQRQVFEGLEPLVKAGNSSALACSKNCNWHDMTRRLVVVAAFLYFRISDIDLADGVILWRTLIFTRSFHLMNLTRFRAWGPRLWRWGTMQVMCAEHSSTSPFLVPTESRKATACMELKSMAESLRRRTFTKDFVSHSLLATCLLQSHKSSFLGGCLQLEADTRSASLHQDRAHPPREQRTCTSLPVHALSSRSGASSS